MIEKLTEYLSNKKVLILGFGMEGISTYKFIRKNLAEQKIYIADKNEEVFEKNSFIKEDQNVQLIYGNDYLESLENFDIIMKTPGLSFAKIDISKFKDKIKSQVELLLEFSDSTTIGVTGTKGKSTTSSLIYKIIADQSKDVLLLGNIGLPIFDYLEDIKKETILVLELSSHQLEFVKCSPKIAILLNIFEEHLDHYKSYQNYIDAKMNIFKFQKQNDYLLYNPDNKLLKENVEKILDGIDRVESNIIKISLDNMDNNKNNIISKIDNNILNEKNTIYKINNNIVFDGKNLYNSTNERKILGNHNLHNIMFALGVSEILGLDLNKTIQTINHFEPLPHRMEFVGKFKDVLYYNDSIATIPESAISTITTLKDISSLIIGGMDRGIDYSSFIDFLNNSSIKNIICLPITGHLIADKISNSAINIYRINTMEEAVEIAKNVTEKNKICLLSPAAASYGFYKNFQERGNEFKRLVK